MFLYLYPFMQTLLFSPEQFLLLQCSTYCTEIPKNNRAEQQYAADLKRLMWD